MPPFSSYGRCLPVGAGGGAVDAAVVEALLVPVPKASTRSLSAGARLAKGLLREVVEVLGFWSGGKEVLASGGRCSGSGQVTVRAVVLEDVEDARHLREDEHAV